MKYLLITFYFLSLIQNACAENVNPLELDQLIQSKISDESPGIAVGVVKKGEIIYEKYVGYANLSDQIKINSNSKFNIASNAKQFTALAVLSLVNQDKLQLEEDFRKYLPDYFPHIKEKITVQHLLNHSSGIRDYSDLLSLQSEPWWKQVGLDNTDVLNLIKDQKELNFKPGTAYLYSNTGYIILSALVAEISGISFKQFSTALFKTMGMHNTYFNDNYMAVVKNKTLPYNNWGDGQWQQYPMVVDLHGDGFLYSTLKDQLIWEQLIHTKTDDLSKLIQFSQENPNKNSSNKYGFGIEFNHYKGQKIREHAGSTGSYNAHFMRFPAEKLSLVVMSNNGNVWSTGLAREIADIILQLKSTQQFSVMPEQITSKPPTKDITGIYRLHEADGSSTVITIFEKSHKLYRKIQNREDIQLVHVKGNVYQYETNKELRIAFIKNSKGDYDFELYHSASAMRLAHRLKDAPTSSEYYKALEGSYFSDELGIDFSLTHQDGSDFIIEMNGNTIKSSLLSYDFMKFNNYSLNFTRDKNDQVKDVLISFNRVRNLRFKKSNDQK
ncbi:MAG: serine hydrolase domain-containing protein [Marinicellaceae bacterium]